METASLQLRVWVVKVRCRAGGPCSDPGPDPWRNSGTYKSDFLVCCLEIYIFTKVLKVILLHIEVWDPLIWFRWEMHPLYNVWKSKHRNHSSFPFKRNRLYYLSGVSPFLQKYKSGQKNSMQLSITEFSKCLKGRERSQDPEDMGNLGP